jgi:Alpha 1,4-glycosyltransferase conserved region
MAGDIQGLWVGDRLSVMEQLCIRSFQKHGHRFVLYVYGDTAGIPPGTVVADGNSILPASRIFTYREHKTYAGFANIFRYKLLLEKGGWFVDADLVCLRPFDFQDQYVFSSEGINGRQVVNVGAIKAPPGSEILQYAWDACEQMYTAELTWSQCGPTLFGKAVEALSLQRHVQPWRAFCPVHFSAWNSVLDPSVPWNFPRQTHAIHLWNELWRRSGQNKDARYDAGCLYEQLKQRYLE